MQLEHHSVRWCVCVYISIMLIVLMGDLSIYLHLKCVILIKTNDKYNPSDENAKKKEEMETATNTHETATCTKPT